MKKLINPWAGKKEFNCFGCSPDNSLGLKMSFYEEGNFLLCNWEAPSHFQGYTGVLHGGIQSTLMDEIASWTVFIKAETGGVTSRMETKFRKPVYINKGNIKLRAQLISLNRKLASVHVELFDSSGQLCAEAKVDYFLFTEKQAMEKLLYPGRESFYDQH